MEKLHAAASAQAADKAFVTLAARFALAGHELRRAADGSLYVARWGLVRALRDLQDAKDWLRQASEARA